MAMRFQRKPRSSSSDSCRRSSASQQCPAADHPGVVGEQAHEAGGNAGLAAARFSNEAQGLSAVQLKAHVLHGPDFALPDPVGEGQAVDLQAGAVRHLRRRGPVLQLFIAAPQSRVYHLV